MFLLPVVYIICHEIHHTIYNGAHAPYKWTIWNKINIGCGELMKFSCLYNFYIESRTVKEYVCISAVFAYLCYSAYGTAMDVWPMVARPLKKKTVVRHENTECLICYEVQSDFAVLSCGHDKMCAGCYEKWAAAAEARDIEPVCPFCRA